MQLKKTLQKDKSVLSGKSLRDFNPRAKEDNESETQVIKLFPDEDKKEYKNLIDEAEQAEKNKDLSLAAKLYKQQVKKHPEQEYSYERLMIIYRKQKMYKEELELINQGIKFFQNYYQQKLNNNVGDNTKVKQISSALMKSLGLTDKKGSALYEPQPIPKWKKRKAVVEKKLGLF